MRVKSPRVGAWFTGRNEPPERTWETRSEVVAADPGREFAFVVHGTSPGGVTRSRPLTAAPATESWEFLPRGFELFGQRFGDDAPAQSPNGTETPGAGIAAHSRRDQARRRVHRSGALFARMR